MTDLVRRATAMVIGPTAGRPAGAIAPQALHLIRVRSRVQRLGGGEPARAAILLVGGLKAGPAFPIDDVREHVGPEVAELVEQLRHALDAPAAQRPERIAALARSSSDALAVLVTLAERALVHHKNGAALTRDEREIVDVLMVAAQDMGLATDLERPDTLPGTDAEAGGGQDQKT